MKLILSYLKLLLFVFAVCLVLEADNCQSATRIMPQHLLLEKPQAAYLLFPLAQESNSDAVSALTRVAIDMNDPYWLAVAGQLGSSGALYYSAMRSKDPKDIRTWLETSAQLGHAQSQFEFALLQKSNAEKRRWMSLSANAGYKPAIIAMAKYTFEANDNSDARFWLNKAADFDASSAFKLANLQWKQGERELAIAFFDKAKQQGFGPAETALNIINKHSVNPLSALLDVAPQGPNCAQSIQFVATSLVSFIQATAFHQTFEKDKRLADLPLCIMPPIWLSTDSLACSSNFNDEPRLGCELYPLSKSQTPLSFTHLIIFAEQGKANVNNGVMYLDQSDTYSVFVHELAHFAGFVDEYALPKNLANFHCNKNTAPNMLLKAFTAPQSELEASGPLAYVPTSRASTWKQALEAHNQLQELETARPILHHIARSQTCKNTEFVSYKPTQQMTFLEYHDVPNIPRVYRTLWRQALLNRANYPAINDNLAISAFANDDDEAGLFWSDL